MRPNGLRVNAKSEAPEILIYDEIGPAWAGMISADAVIEALNSFGSASRVTVRINSIGGSVFEGFAIFNALARHSAQIVVEIDALAASAASLVAMAGDRIRIASNAMMMIHRAWVIVAGNKRELQHVIGILERVDDNLADTYAARTKKPKAKIEQLLDAETWFTAEEAVKEGFADQITAAVNASAYVPAGRFQNTPRRFLESRPGASVERVREQLSEMRERLLLNR